MPLISGVLRVLALLPLPALRALGTALGFLLSFSPARIARTTRTNIALCYPNLSSKQQKNLVRESLCATGCTIFELAAIWHWKGKALDRLFIRFDGKEELTENLCHGAVLCVLPHWGNWELIIRATGTLNFATTALYDARRLSSHTRRVTQMRSRFGLNLVPADQSGLRNLLRVLKGSELAVVLPDQVPTRGSSELAKFMGVPAVTSTIVRSLLQRTDAIPMLLTFERVPKGFHIRAESLSPDVGHDDPNIATQALNDEIAQAIERDPAQYQWEYKRFRRVPGKDVYQTGS